MLGLVPAHPAPNKASCKAQSSPNLSFIVHTIIEFKSIRHATNPTKKTSSAAKVFPNSSRKTAGLRLPPKCSPPITENTAANDCIRGAKKMSIASMRPATKSSPIMISTSDRGPKAVGFNKSPVSCVNRTSKYWEQDHKNKKKTGIDIFTILLVLRLHDSMGNPKTAISGIEIRCMETSSAAGSPKRMHCTAAMPQSVDATLTYIPISG
mmetsp:Transcript_93862/g.176428  ORF Transcript_93862/g.176428 Transcript_93862/m.176428 type:complete len:209 (+) Transcript_93862:379-1005(+)